MAESNLSSAVSKQIEEIQKAGGHLTEESLEQLARTIASNFKVRQDELAILRLSPDGKVLNFLYPVQLSKIGAIPLTLSHSLATKTIRDKKAEIINNFSGYKHPTFFEAVDISEQDKATPIQKIMSAPVIVKERVVGVVQVCRKARPGERMGPDFKSGDLAQLSGVAAVLGKFLAEMPAAAPTPAKPPGS
jgi:signal transduction protein with GAF and PtsI domain